MGEIFDVEVDGSQASTVNCLNSGKMASTLSFYTVLASIAVGFSTILKSGYSTGRMVFLSKG